MPAPTLLSSGHVQTQTGSNVGKVRWLQDNFQAPILQDPYATEYFISSSCAEPASTITLWKLQMTQDEYAQVTGKIDKVDKVSSFSSVTDMVSINTELFATTTSTGEVAMYKCPKGGISDNELFNRIEHVYSKDLHHIKMNNSNKPIGLPARAIATNGSSLLTAGEDGSLYEIDVETKQVARSLERADHLSIHCIAFVSRVEVLSGNTGGQLKLWDLRSETPSPLQTMTPNIVTNNIYGVVSMAVHPSQQHLVIVGYQNGCMDLFDLRSGSGCDPIANLAASDDGGSLSELYFHEINPDHFFSCSQAGQVCQWYPGQQRYQHESLDRMMYTPDVNVEFLKRGLVFKPLYSSPFPMNSLNISKHDRLIAGSDSGVIMCTQVNVHM